MITRPTGLDLRRSLRSALGEGAEAAVEAAATRQERTIDAVLERLYCDDEAQRRELVLLADEVGLGKTFVALGVAWSVLHQRKAAGLSAGPVLVVTPHAHALFNKWRREAERFLQLVAPAERGFAIRAVSTPHELARALCERRPALVIARMSALSGRLHRLDTARLVALHALFRMDGFSLGLEQRLRLVQDSRHATPERLDLRRSAQVRAEAEEADEIVFEERHVFSAWKRLQKVDPRLCERLEGAWRKARDGGSRSPSFWEDLREVCRAAMGQTVPHRLPLVIVDEIHNWKNHPSSWQRFLHTLGHRVDRLLGLSATPFQLGPHELIRVLELRQCLSLSQARARLLDHEVARLRGDLELAQGAGDKLRSAWAEVAPGDCDDLVRAWETNGGLEGLPPRLRRAIEAASEVREANQRLARGLRPFISRHRRDVSHRAWWVGREAAPGGTVGESVAAGGAAPASALRWRPGLDVSGEAELVHYVTMRAVQSHRERPGSPAPGDEASRVVSSLGADLGGSYGFFRESTLQALQKVPGQSEEAGRYLDWLERASSGMSHEHPKVAVTAERAFRAWLDGEKTLIFCFNLRTVAEVQEAVNRRVERHITEVLERAFQCRASAVKQRLENLQRRLYDHHQSVFLLFQDHPLAGSDGRVPAALALGRDELGAVAERLALRGGPPQERSRFSRREVLAAVEQVLVERWGRSGEGRAWLEAVLGPLRLADTVEGAMALISASDWAVRRRELVEGVSREGEHEALAEDEAAGRARESAGTTDVDAWLDVVRGRAGQAVLAPYLAEARLEVPSLLSRWHARALHGMPAPLRALATRMLRRLVRSRGFLARHLLAGDDGLVVESGAAEEDWTVHIHRGYTRRPGAEESARERFEAYLDSLKKAVGLEEQVAAYEDASRNRELVARVTGKVPSAERDRLIVGFNSPLVPEVLIVTTVGQEGIDLHRECRHVIHHDLPWNPATLEQRTGRVDRIGSKTERLRAGRTGEAAVTLDVVVPYIAGTYDEHRFRVVQGRAHLFEVTMGGEYSVDGHRPLVDAMQAEETEDDPGEAGRAWVPVPERIARDLRLDLESGPSGARG